MRHPELTVQVHVPRGWAVFADAGLCDAASREIGMGLDATLAQCGVPGRVTVTVQAVDCDPRDHPAEPAMEVSINGSVLRCAPELSARVQAATLEAPLCAGHFATPDWLLAPAATDAARTRARRYAGMLCCELVKQHPSELLTPEAVDAVAATLSAHGAGIAAEDRDALGAILRHLLEQRIGIRALKRIAAHWNAGRAARKSALQIAESLSDDGDGPAVRMLANRATWRSLTLDAGADNTLATSMRDSVYFDLGVLLPAARLECDDSLPDDAFAFSIGAWTTPAVFGLHPHEWLEALEGTQAGDRLAVLHPRTLAPLRLRKCDGTTPPANGIGPLRYLFACLDAALRDLAPCFVRQRAVEEALATPAMVGAASVRVFRMRHGAETLTQVLRRLAAEQVFNRNLRCVVESLCNFDHVTLDAAELIVFDERLAAAVAPNPAWLADPQTLTAFVRIGLKRQITHAVLRGGRELGALLVDRQIEKAFAAVARPDTWNGARRLPPDQERALLRGLHECVRWSAGSRAPVLLTTVEARTPLRRLVADVWPLATVLAYQELTADTNIRSLGRVKFVD
jgi:hypothetical protein